MNIKNWFNSPEGPMDLEAEVRKLRSSNRWLIFMLIVQGLIFGYFVYLYTQIYTQITTIIMHPNHHIGMLILSKENMRQLLFTQNKDIITDVLLKNLEERGYELKMKDAQ